MLSGNNTMLEMSWSNRLERDYQKTIWSKENAMNHAVRRKELSNCYKLSHQKSFDWQKQIDHRQTWSNPQRVKYYLILEVFNPLALVIGSHHQAKLTWLDSLLVVQIKRDHRLHEEHYRQWSSNENSLRQAMMEIHKEVFHLVLWALLNSSSQHGTHKTICF